MARCRPVRLPMLLAGIVVTVAIAGCATAPSGGAPRRATGGGSQVQAYVQPLPPPPPTSSAIWGPTNVVLGFLHASASYAFDPAAAEQYLEPPLRKSWHPATGNQPVAVVGAPTTTSFTVAPYKPQIQQEVPFEKVTFTGQRLATLSPTGQYQYAPGQNVQYQFILAKFNGVWLIQRLPSQPGLLLTQSDFDAVYQARNLFFYAPAPASQPPSVLVPDPVYAPLQSSNSALNTNLATGLVNGLLKGQGDWLSGATWSAFPAGTRLLKQVTITGRVAQVDLGGAAVHANGLQLQLMEAQLRATLGDRNYSAPLASQVELYINNALQNPGGASSGTTLVPPVATGPIVVVTKAGGVGQLPARPRAAAIPTVRVTPAQIGRASISAIAADPTGGRTPPLAIAVPNQAGCGIYLTGSGQQAYHFYPLAASGGTCTSLTWDNSGNVWASAGRAVWLLPAANRQPALVGVTALATIDQPGSRIQALAMAPDGVRAAVLVHTPKSGNKLLLTAVHFDHGAGAFGQPVSIGIGGADPTAISWLDAFHLAVLAGGAGAIFEVPLIGGAGLQPGGSLPSIGSTPAGAQTMTTDGSELVVGTVDGSIYALSPASPGWIPVTTGSDPVYPG